MTVVFVKHSLKFISGEIEIYEQKTAFWSDLFGLNVAISKEQVAYAWGQILDVCYIQVWVSATPPHPTVVQDVKPSTKGRSMGCTRSRVPRAKISTSVHAETYLRFLLKAELE